MTNTTAEPEVGKRWMPSTHPDPDDRSSGGDVVKYILSVAIGFVLIAAASCSSQGAELEVGEGPLVYVPMGNSLTFSPRGSSVNERVEEALGEHFGVDVEVRDHTVGGQRTDAFLDRLINDEGLRNDLADADVITFVIPNDEFAEPSMTATGVAGRDPADCGGEDNQQCLRDMVAVYNAQVDQIFSELMAIVDPTEQVIRVQDFYLFHTESPLEASRVLYPYWAETQEHVRDVAASHGIPVAKVWDAFMGPDGDIPDLVAAGLVEADGIHLTPAGTEKVASLYRDLGYDLAS